MHSQKKMHDLVDQIQPALLYLGHGRISRQITATWPLPAGRILFALQAVNQSSYSDETPVGTHYLFVLDQVRASVRQVGDTAGYGEDDEAVTLAAVEWMQGLRNEDLEPFDKHMIDWLGEMAYRMRPEHLEQFQGQYFAIPPDAWGTHENPDDSAAEQLADLIAAMGYSEHAIDEHLF